MNEIFGVLMLLEIAPLIREVVNVHLLKNGFEKERLQYTRIGLPFYDLKEIFTDPDKSETAISEI